MGPIARYLCDDHTRLRDLLARAAVDPAAYADFRAGLLRHIGMEEKVLFPAAQRANNGQPLAATARLHLDHGAIVSLLVPSPTSAIRAALRDILEQHDRVEEGPGGVYELCEKITDGDTDALLASLRSYPAVPMHPHVDSESVLGATRRALARAGYSSEGYGI